MRENLTNSCVFPLKLSSGVNSYAPLLFFYCSTLGVHGDTCGPVCPTAAFMEIRKGMKVTQNELIMSKRRDGGAGGKGFSYACHVPPHPPPPNLLLLNSPSSPPHYFFSSYCYLRCCMLSVSCLQL